jgi:hypothetical protein
LFSDDRSLLGTADQGERQRFLTRSFDWTFTSNAYWGESAAGTWTLEVLNRAQAGQLIGRSGIVNDVSFAFDTGSITLTPRGTGGTPPQPGGTEGYVMSMGSVARASTAVPGVPGTASRPAAAAVLAWQAFADLSSPSSRRATRMAVVRAIEVPGADAAFFRPRS